ncbi:alpha/beta-hydrolase [Amylostereum chailletii]|nr:alpha/beta-hydrolase [Amylostereum chailletii]
MSPTTAGFTIPEMVDLPSGLRLQTHMLVPLSSAHEPALPKMLAVCSHPWSRLGGCMSDPVLHSVAHPLKDLGYHVLLFNSRGVQGSSGWASFTGFQEAEDLKELVEYILEKLGSVQDLVFVGYSNGCLISSLQPPMDPPVRTSHVLLSYPLGPRSFLTLFNGRTYQQRLEDLVRHPRSRVLLIYGDADEFTAADSYETWATGLRTIAENERTGGDELPENRSEQDIPESTPLCVVEFIPGASHFWRGGAVKPMVLAIRDFLRVH